MNRVWIRFVPLKIVSNMKCCLSLTSQWLRRLVYAGQRFIYKKLFNWQLRRRVQRCWELWRSSFVAIRTWRVQKSSYCQSENHDTPVIPLRCKLKICLMDILKILNHPICCVDENIFIKRMNVITFSFDLKNA